MAQRRRGRNGENKEEARRHFEEQGIICPANKALFSESDSGVSGRGREAEREKIERV